MRDAHQSLLATRMRTYDMMKVAEGFAKIILKRSVWKSGEGPLLMFA
jgi:pyruvate carboxylase